MLDADKQQRLRAILPPMPEPPTLKNRAALTAIALALAVNIAATWCIMPGGASGVDLSYPMKRLRDMLAACNGIDPRQVRILVENRVGKPAKQFAEADRATAIDFMLDDLIGSGCVRLTRRPAPQF